MLSVEENHILTRVGPGTAAGDLYRRYWTPALLAEEVGAPDGPIVRFRLLGEDLVAFRDTSGRVGILAEHCPHRGASLGLGVNECGGLRCIYHGYKFAADGECLDTPTEPPDSNFRSRVRATSYAAHESGGVIWAYLGDQRDTPAFPHFSWLGLPDGHSRAFKVLEECNYGQALEGAIDSAHAGVLHRTNHWGEEAKASHEADLSPRLQIQHTQYGFRYGAVRRLPDGSSHVRITAFVLPFWTLIPPDGEGPRANRRLANCFVPRDDTSTWQFQFFFDHTAPIDVAHRVGEGGVQLDDAYRKRRNIDNWYLQDREAMRGNGFSGITGIMVQDHAVSETQGPILDRSTEHLGTSDVAIVAWRRMVLKLARDATQPRDGSSADLPYELISGETVKLPAGEKWQDQIPLAPALSS
jgi:phthalate 4,5-dioxygenase oxygenase subunit